MAEPKLPESTMGVRAIAITRTFRAAFAALDDLRDKSPGEAEVVEATIVSHLRSSSPLAAQLPSVVMPVVASPVLPAAVEAKSQIRTDLHDGAEYTVNRHIDVDAVIGFHVLDAHGGHAHLCMTDMQADKLRSDIASVCASRGARR